MIRPRLASAALVAALVATLGWAHIERSASAARARTARHLEELQAERDTWSFERNALWGETREGAAWPHYAAALARLAAADRDGHKATMGRVIAASAADDGANPGERQSLLVEFGDLLEGVRRGALARDAHMEIPWEQGFSVPIPSLCDSRTLSNLAVVRLLEAVGTEDELDAMRGVLDAQQMARDLAAAPLLISEIIGHALIVPPAIEEHLEQGLARRLSAESKREWLAGLRRLEANMPRGARSLLGEAELAGRAFLTGFDIEWTGGEGSFFTSFKSFKNGLFLESRAAEHVAFMRGLAAEVERADALPGPSALARIRDLQAAHGKPDNPLTAYCLPRIESVGMTRAYARSRLALLRHALELHLGEEGALPEDLFGTGVAVEQDGDMIRVATDQERDSRSRQTIEIVL